MKHQQSSYQTDRKAGKYLTQCMMSQNNPCGTQYTCNQDKQAQPCYGIITEQRTERDQSSDHSTYSCHMLAQFPFQVDGNTNDRNYQRCQNNACHIPGDIQLAHHQQAEYIRDDSQQDRYIAFLTFAQFLTGEAINLTKQENSNGRRQYGKAINNSQHNQLILYRHDTKIRKKE